MAVELELLTTFIMIETLPALSDSTRRSTSLAIVETDPLEGNYTDRLSDELLEHMIDCDVCLNDCLVARESTCPEYCARQAQIRALGGPARGLSFGY